MDYGGRYAVLYALFHRQFLPVLGYADPSLDYTWTRGGAHVVRTMFLPNKSRYVFYYKFIILY